MEELDLVVVGAGIFGLPVAKTYLEVNPSAQILVLDAGKSVGGTWSSERLYDGLMSNNLVGTLEFSDFPMDVETFGVKPGSHLPGTVLHRYLTSYAEHFGFFSRIRFGATVKSAELAEDGNWLIRYDLRAGIGDAKEMKLIAKKLVLATGTTSLPNMPSIAGIDKFGGQVFHSKELPDHNDDMSAAKGIVVLGGSKSAADAVHMNASKGRKVDWVIRASGKGPAWMSTPYVSPANLQFEKLATTRCMTFLSPSFHLDSYPTIRHLLHNTAIGRALVKIFFSIIHSDLIARGKFNDHPETKKLTPNFNVFWSGTAVGIFNYNTDLFDLVRKGLINVHIADITSLSDHTVHLSDGKDIEADILICATGWQHTPNISILPSNISHTIGVSTAGVTDPSVKAADIEIMRCYPELKDQPPAGPNGEREREQTSYVLYRGIVPPAFIKTRNLAYCGMCTSLRGYLVGQTQALWITAFLDGRLSTPLPSEAEAEWDAMLQNRFYRWRAPNGLGPKCTDMVFELLPYVDTLLRDLGLQTARKGGWRELFEYYGVHDYYGLVREWMEKETGTVGL